MKSAYVVSLILALVLTGCNTPWVMDKSELQHWYRDELSRYSGAGKLGYQGTDADFHHFIARPIDDFVGIQVPKNQIKLPEEHPASELGSHRMYFYLVDPNHGFRKILEPSGR
jgi:hypothetical protein